VADFERRAAFLPKKVYHHHARKWRYIPVHFFADEKPEEEALWVDCWCLLGADAALLECGREEHSSPTPKLYVRVDKDSPYWWKLHARFSPTSIITRAAVEEVMERFVVAGFPDNFPFRVQPGCTHQLSE
jgi:hypothetical protein